MTEEESLLIQARSEFTVFKLLFGLNRREVPECHALHYLQMASEKLSKAFLCATQQNYRRVHSSFSTVMHILRRPDTARRLGWANPSGYRKFLDRVRPLLREVEELHPQVGTGPNVEYPWLARDPQGSLSWIAPADYSFGLTSRLQRDGDGQRVTNLIHLLLERFNEIIPR